MRFLNHKIILVAVTFLASVFFYSIFYFNLPPKLGFPDVSLETLYANYDGPNYLVISKCGYDPDCIRHNFSLPQPLEYYPAHLPGYPLAIKIFSGFLPGPQAMLFTTLLGSIILSLVSYSFFKLFVSPKGALTLSLLLLFFPPRLFLLRLIGAPETFFLSFILLSVIFFKKSKYFYSAIFAALAQLFKSPGILLLTAYAVLAVYSILVKKATLTDTIKKYWPYLLVPLTVLFIFQSYYQQTGDFFAYFNSGDNFHLNPLPYLIFVSNRSWVNTIWLEDVIYIFGISLYGIYKLFKKYSFSIVSIFPAIFVIATLFVAHRDISRYISPVYPFLFLAFHRSLLKKHVTIILLLLIPAVILYSINFAIGNVAPVADWTPYN